MVFDIRNYLPKKKEKPVQVGPTIEAAKKLETITGGAKPTTAQVQQALTPTQPKTPTILDTIASMPSSSSSRNRTTTPTQLPLEATTPMTSSQTQTQPKYINPSQTTVQSEVQKQPVMQEEPIVQEPTPIIQQENVPMDTFQNDGTIGPTKQNAEMEQAILENRVSKSGKILDYPKENYALSKSGNIPNLGTSRTGKILTTPEQKTASDNFNKFNDSYMNYVKNGNKLLSGDKRYIESLKPEPGYGDSLANHKDEVEDFRNWLTGFNIPTSTGNNFLLDKFNTAFDKIPGISIEDVDKRVINTIDESMGFVAGLFSWLNPDASSQFQKISTEQSQGDVEEMMSSSVPLVKQLREAGLNDEADLFTENMKSIQAGMEALGVRALQRDQDALVNAATQHVVKAQEAIQISDDIKVKNTKDLENIEIKVKRGEALTPEEIAFGVKQNSDIVIDYESNQNIAANEAEQLEVQQATQTSLVTKATTQSPEDIIKDPEWISFVSDPNNQGTLAYRIYTDAQSDAQATQELKDKRIYDEYLASKQREQDIQDRDEARRYKEEQDALNLQRQQEIQTGIDATATESSGSSVLNFGLLGSSGDTQYVDKDKASQYYFKADYEELTPAQKKLLQLAKGDN